MLSIEDSTILEGVRNSLYNKKPLSGPDGILARLLKQVLEDALGEEIEHHLVEHTLEESANRRDGKLTKKSAISLWQL